MSNQLPVMKCWEWAVYGKIDHWCHFDIIFLKCNRIERASLLCWPFTVVLLKHMIMATKITLLDFTTLPPTPSTVIRDHKLPARKHVPYD